MKFLLINGAAQFAHSGGRLNDTLHARAVQVFKGFGYTVDETVIAKGYDNAQEVQKYLPADVVVYQMAGWWMGVPWPVKKYIDDVFTAGHGSLYRNDGRSRTNPSQNYGTGGMLENKRYMLSVTWNAPLEAFNEFGNFFDGRGVEGVYYTFHKAQQFIGLKALPTFIANDVEKAPDVPATLVAYEAHLKNLFAV